MLRPTQSTIGAQLAKGLVLVTIGVCATQIGCSTMLGDRPQTTEKLDKVSAAKLAKDPFPAADDLKR